MLPEIVAGVINAWSGSVVSIPSGWALCDGTNGTPDLTDKFIVGAGDTYAPGNNAGAHVHDFTSDGHEHVLPSASDVEDQATFELNDRTVPAVATGTTDPPSSLPPYYALAYIMKL